MYLHADATSYLPHVPNQSQACEWSTEIQYLHSWLFTTFVYGHTLKVHFPFLRRSAASWKRYTTIQEQGPLHACELTRLLDAVFLAAVLSNYLVTVLAFYSYNWALIFTFPCSELALRLGNCVRQFTKKDNSMWVDSADWCCVLCSVEYSYLVTVLAF